MAAEATETQHREADVEFGPAKHHRLASTDQNRIPVLDDDSDHDSDDIEEDDVASEFTPRADSIVSISISRAQDDIRSPATPAATKAQVLEATKSYFEEPEASPEFTDEPLQQESSTESDDAVPGREAVFEPTAQASNRQSSTTEAETKQQKRSSFVSSILGNAVERQRQRSSSGSSIVENIKKRLPTLPSVSLPRITSSVPSEQRVLGPFGPGLLIGSESTHGNGRSPSDGIHARQDPNWRTPEVSMSATRIRGFDGASESKTSPHTPRLLRHATSDQSLYLRREATGASAFDDYNAFANVSEMVNSRFKAITDSFQDSALRRPRLLSVKEGDRPWMNRSNSNETKENTRTNTGSTHEPIKQHKDPSINAGESTNSQHPILKHTLSQMSGDLVIMGGYRGSILRDAAPPHRQLWVPIKVGMNLRRADLEVGLTREDELKMEETIIADGTLSHIGPVDICRRLIKKCRRCPNVQKDILRIHDYGYDWRLSPELLGERLTRFLERLPCNQKEVPIKQRGAWLISHSLGGSITRHVINKRPELVAGVVYAGTPQNCVNILGPLRNGDDVLFSSRVLTAQVNFTMRTSYALLPEEGRCFINKTSGERYDVDFFDAKTWEDYCLSPCIRSPVPRSKPDKRNSWMDSISEAMSQPGKHLSWLTNSGAEQSTTPENMEHKSRARDRAEDALEDITESADAVVPEKPLSPNMGDRASRNHKSSIATTSSIPIAVATEYLSRTLGEILRFKQEVKHKPELQAKNAYPPATVLYAKNTPTVYGAFVNSREEIKYDDAFDDLAFAAGDGVVLASSAQLPAGYRCVRNGRVETDRGHVGLLGDLEAVGKCLRALLEARSKGVGLGAYEAKSSEDSSSQEQERNR